MTAERGCIDAKEKDFSDATVSEYDRFGGGLVMVWAGVTMNQRTWLGIVDGNLNAQRSVDKILLPVVVPFLSRIHQGAVLQDDSALPHRGRVVKMNLSDRSTSGDLTGRPTHLISTQSSISGMSWETYPILNFLLYEKSFFFSESLS